MTGALDKQNLAVAAVRYQRCGLRLLHGHCERTHLFHHLYVSRRITTPADHHGPHDLHLVFFPLHSAFLFIARIWACHFTFRIGLRSTSLEFHSHQHRLARTIVDSPYIPYSPRPYLIFPISISSNSRAYSNLNIGITIHHHLLSSFLVCLMQRPHPSASQHHRIDTTLAFFYNNPHRSGS